MVAEVKVRVGDRMMVKVTVLQEVLLGVERAGSGGRTAQRQDHRSCCRGKSKEMNLF